MRIFSNSQESDLLFIGIILIQNLILAAYKVVKFVDNDYHSLLGFSTILFFSIIIINYDSCFIHLMLEPGFNI